MIDNATIISEARKDLEQGLYFGNGHITRATDAELISFAKSIAFKTVMEVVAAIKAPAGSTEKIYVADAVHRAMSVLSGI